MSNSRDRIRASRRRLRDENAVKRQTGIAKMHGAPVAEPHRYVKHHAMDCGQPGCALCGNPRRTFQERTIQEQRQMQDVDKPTNGDYDDGKN
jgi:hypothetical protein